MRRTYRYATLDVFTETPFGGNPLAVFPDARGLATAQMQALAAEFNYSETTFVLPPAAPDHTAQVRIFTPRWELPFAGHPNVGTAVCLARLGAVHGRQVAGDTLLFEEGAGLVAVAVERAAGEAVGATLTAPAPLSIGGEVPVETVAAALSLPAEAILTRRHPPVFASVGLPFLMIELADRAALERAKANVAAIAEATERYGAGAARLSLHLYTRRGADTGSEGSVDLRARMFSPLGGVPEDPATGSANAALTGFLAALAPEPDLDYSVRIAQGVEMGRPSRLLGRARKRGGTVERVEIGGRCVPMMAGEVTLEAAG
ncbi:MAG TPA: PhzF family phenazine biosynthesis protein [Stellaceae bacterium]|nr:PhzF family phenazine biosynthesis protein [Stellaceae bacterium]